MRKLAMQVVIETADYQLHRLANQGRRSIRRLRHETTLWALLADHDKARQFLAHFILRRECMVLLRPEFVPECFRASMRYEKLKAAIMQDAN
jgi:hypothetical protein